MGVSNIALISNSILRNKAEIGGIIYHYLNFKKIILISNKFLLNQAKFYGKKFSSEIKSIKFAKEFEVLYKKLQIINIVSSAKFFPCTFKYIAGIDAYNNSAYMSDEDYNMSIIQVVPTKNFSNKISMMKNNGFLCLRKVKRNQIPLKKYFKYNLFLKNIGDNPKYNLELKISIRNCKIGERFLQDLVCEECFRSTYSFERNFKKLTEFCRDCEKMQFNCFGGFNLTPKKSYWRFSSKSTKFFECPNPFACLGDPRNFSLSSYYPHFAIGICGEGYSGIKCGVCTDDYGIINKIICIKCSKMYYLKIISILFIKLIFCLYSVYSGIVMSKSIMKNENVDIGQVASSNGIKILNNHIQILGLLASLPFQFPLKFNYNLSIALSISPSDPGSAFSIECLLRKYNWAYSLQYFKLIITYFFPFLIILIVSFIYLILKRVKFFKDWANLNENSKIIYKDYIFQNNNSFFWCHNTSLLP